MFEVIPSSPANCADQLSTGNVNIGLIPSIEYQRIENLMVIPGISIASIGQVRSILLIQPKGKQDIRSVALDSSSRTSVGLVRILLEERMKIRPDFISCAPDLGRMLERCDAALLIGDAALKVPLDAYRVIDLGEEWLKWQQTPFVTAFWACRTDAALPPDLNSTFQEAKEWGLKRRKEIASAYARRLDLPPAFLEEYLHRNIDYDLGPAHIEGLQKFYRLANGKNLTAALRPIRFVGADA